MRRPVKREGGSVERADVVVIDAGGRSRDTDNRADAAGVGCASYVSTQNKLSC